jgi:3alpha(or 20beta)-hydroxysteroid dehydrogenase
MGRLEGKVAIVTGAAQGMGEAAARRFVTEGARVMVADVRPEGEALAASLGDAARFVRLDVASEADWVHARERTLAAFGRLDVLLNNAGIVRTAPLADTTLADYRAVIDVNQTGVFLGMKTAVLAMTAAGGGSILNVSSIDGFVGMPNVIAYVASKFAVRGMTKAAAIELAPLGIRVNSIHPGYIDTPMLAREASQRERLAHFCADHVPAARLGRPEEVAALAVFLASDESSYCTGTEFVADGGVLAGHDPGRGHASPGPRG